MTFKGERIETSRRLKDENKMLIPAMKNKDGVKRKNSEIIIKSSANFVRFYVKTHHKISKKLQQYKFHRF